VGTEKVRLAIVVAEFNYDVTYLMLQRALAHAKFLGVQVKVVFKVPGSFEIPLAVSKLVKMNEIDAVATLGAVIKGETKHDESVAAQVFRKIMDISLESGKPVTIGIIGPGASHEQAVDRIEEYAVRAVESAVKMAKRLKGLGELGEGTVTIE